MPEDFTGSASCRKYASAIWSRLKTGSSFFAASARNAFRIVFGDARDLLQLDATAFDGVAADDGARVGEEHDAP